MAIFKKTSNTAKAKTKAKAQHAEDEVLTPESQQQPASTSTVGVKSGKGQAGESYRLLLKPVVSEKAAHLAAANIYAFRVPVDAEKIAIMRAVKSLYGVTVEDVRTARGIGKKVYRGRRVGQRNAWKKAFVSVKPGQKIDLYEGV